MKYRFTWGITINCNYQCEYCGVYGNENYSSIDTINQVLNFFIELNKLNDTEYIEIQLFGGECTLHPNFLYIVEQLSKLNNVGLILFTNLSADIDIYDKFCAIANGRIKYIAMSFHYNHCDEKEYKNKIKYILDIYPDIEMVNQCMLAKNRYTENDYINIFSEFKGYNQFSMSLFPLLNVQNEFIEVNYNNINENLKDALNIHINKNTKNNRRGKYCDCFKTNAFITSQGILKPCFEKLDGAKIDLTKDNVISIYKVLRNIKIMCNKSNCYYYTNWEWH